MPVPGPRGLRAAADPQTPAEAAQALQAHAEQVAVARARDPSPPGLDERTGFVVREKQPRAGAQGGGRVVEAAPGIVPSIQFAAQAKPAPGDSGQVQVNGMLVSRGGETTTPTPVRARASSDSSNGRPKRVILLSRVAELRLLSGTIPRRNCPSMRLRARMAARETVDVGDRRNPAGRRPAPAGSAAPPPNSRRRADARSGPAAPVCSARARTEPGRVPAAPASVPNGGAGYGGTPRPPRREGAADRRLRRRHRPPPPRVARRPKRPCPEGSAPAWTRDGPPRPAAGARVPHRAVPSRSGRPRDRDRPRAAQPSRRRAAPPSARRRRRSTPRRSGSRGHVGCASVGGRRPFMAPGAPQDGTRPVRQSVSPATKAPTRARSSFSAPNVPATFGGTPPGAPKNCPAPTSQKDRTPNCPCPTTCCR